MAEDHAPGSRLDVHLPDGAHLTVAVEVDEDALDDVEMAIAAAVVAAGDLESQVEAAVGDAAAELGRRAATRKIRQTKLITIR
jgi:hypothetical protein